MSNDFAFSLSPNADQMKIEIIPTDDPKTALGVIGDAHEVEAIIFNLALGRAKMKPPVPHQLDPRPVFKNSVSGTVFHVSTAQLAIAKKPKDVTLAALHPGIGWIAFVMSPASAAQLASMLMTKALEAEGRLPVSPLVGVNGKPLI
jgi:hypothetical protein